MAETTHIEWTDATWNPITGCSVVSPGCTNCYAMKLAGTRLRDHPSREGLTQPSKAGPVWTGEVRFNAQWLGQPLNWRKPRMIFVCAHADLFHPAVPDGWIDQIFAVMSLTPWHDYQVLTKRSDRMRAYMNSPHLSQRIARVVLDLLIDGLLPKGFLTDSNFDARWPVVGDHPEDVSDVWLRSWPLPNVWLGVSVEDQARADQRIPDLLHTPAAVRWISAEPLLGPVNLWKHLFIGAEGGIDFAYTPRNLINWVVVGGESGINARPMHPDWAREIRDQCRRAEVPFFFKQWGSWKNGSDFAADAKVVLNDGRVVTSDRATMEELDSKDYPLARFKPTMMRHVGKKAAGDLLDDVRHHQWPKVTP